MNSGQCKNPRKEFLVGFLGDRHRQHLLNSPYLKSNFLANGAERRVNCCRHSAVLSVVNIYLKCIDVI